MVHSCVSNCIYRCVLFTNIDKLLIYKGITFQLPGLCVVTEIGVEVVLGVAVRGTDVVLGLAVIRGAEVVLGVAVRGAEVPFCVTVVTDAEVVLGVAVRGAEVLFGVAVETDAEVVLGLAVVRGVCLVVKMVGVSVVTVVVAGFGDGVVLFSGHN